MSTRVEPGLTKTLEKFGLIDNQACYHCGNCTAICNLTEGDRLFPRRAIKYAQLGLKDKLDQSVEPWLCYYCGDCSKECPRDANPGEQMMALRRYLTSIYDWTGLSFKFYTSKAWELGAVLFVAALVVAVFVVLHAIFPGHYLRELATAPDGSRYVPLNAFAPMEYVHRFDWGLAGVLATFLLSNVLRMYFKIVRSDRNLRVPLLLYLRKAGTLGVHFATQMRLLKCDRKFGFWFMHVFFVTGYLTMLTLVVVLLPWFQIDSEGINWTTYFGYYATAALLYGCVYCMVGRVRKKETHHEFSHFSDWMFLVLLLLTVVTGILVHVLRYYLKLTDATYAMYVLHLAVSVPMLVIEVPFSKWAHLAYRPVALYLADVRSAARELQGGSQ